MEFDILDLAHLYGNNLLSLIQYNSNTWSSAELKKCGEKRKIVGGKKEKRICGGKKEIYITI